MSAGIKLVVDNEGGGDAAAPAGDPFGVLGGGSGGGGSGPGVTAPAPLGVVPLGQADGTYYFLSPGGELRRLKVRDMTSGGLSGLYDGRVWLLAARFPPHGRNKSEMLFHASDAMVELQRQCAEAGFYDDSMPVRGQGVWRCAPEAGDGGALLVHSGDRIHTIGADGRLIQQPAGLRRGGAIYPVRAAVEAPAALPADAEAGSRLLASLQLWEYEQPAAPLLVLGFICAAYLGAAIGWRPHMRVSAHTGAGKSTQMELVEAALGGAGHAVLNDSTEAGLRQAFTAQARAILLDEVEPGAQGGPHGAGRMQALIELLRRASGGGGARSARGSAGGRAESYSITACAYMAAILPVPLQPQDRNRITEIGLKPLPEAAGTEAARQAARAAIEAARAASPALRTRALLGVERFGALFSLYRGLVMARHGSARNGDQLGTLLAGAELLLTDGMPDEELASRRVTGIASLIESAVTDGEEGGEGHECLNHLLSSQADVLWRDGVRSTVGELVAAARRDDTGWRDSNAVKALGKMGMRVETERIGLDATAKDVEHLCVANIHRGLSKIFDDSRWRGGTWRAALLYLAGARPWPDKLRFGGAESRSVAIDERWLPDAGDGGRS